MAQLNSILTTAATEEGINAKCQLENKVCSLFLYIILF